MRRVLAVVIAAIGADTASAQAPRPEELAQAYACRAATNEAERLACYDSAIDRMLAAEEGGDFVAVDRSRVGEVQSESFGFNLPSIADLMPRAGGDLQHLQLEVDRVVSLPDGRKLFVMTNGQRWIQVENESAHNVRAGDSVTVRRAALGTYLLTSERGGAGHRVRRQD